MQGPTLVAIPAMWECHGTMPSPMDAQATLPAHANTCPTPTKTRELPFQALPSPLLNWRPNVPPPVLPPPPMTPTSNVSPVNSITPPPCNPSPCHAIHMHQKALLRAHQNQHNHHNHVGAAVMCQAQAELQDFDGVDEYVAYLEREVGRVELISFRVRTPDGRLTLFESEIPTMRRRSIHSNSGLKVDIDCCVGDAVDVAERNLAEWEEREMMLPRTALSMPDMRRYSPEVHAITEPSPMMSNASFRSPASFAAVGYNQAIPHTVQGVPMMMSQPSPGSLQSLVAAANMSQQQPLLNIRQPFAVCPLSPSNVLPITPPNNAARGPHMHAAAIPAGMASNSTTPTANLLTPDSPDFADVGSESPHSGSTADDDESASGQRTSLKPALPGCQHSAYWKRLRHKKGTTHFLCVLCGCKWRRVSRDGEEE